MDKFLYFIGGIMNQRVRIIAEIAVFVALAFVIELLFSVIPGMQQGGRISISLLPIIVIAWRRGVFPGVIAGLVFAWLNSMLDGFNQGWFITFESFVISMLLDYVLAFALVGFAGLVRVKGTDNIVFFGIAIFIGYFIRFSMHFISGIVVFGIYAPDGQSPWIYSLIYNGTYMLPSLVLALIAGLGLYYRVGYIINNTETL
jgi:thiamine transporter